VLGSALKDENPWVRFPAAERLLQVDPWAGEAESVLRAFLHGTPDAHQLRAAGELLSRHPGEKELVSLLLQGLKDGDDHLRREAVQSCIRIRHLEPSIEEALRITLSVKANRLEAAWALILLGSKEDAVVPVLAEELESPDFHARRLAARCLGRLGPAAVPASAAILKALGDEDDEVRSMAGTCIGRMGSAAPEEVRTFLNGLLADQDERVRAWAEATIQRIRGEAPTEG